MSTIITTSSGTAADLDVADVLDVIDHVIVIPEPSQLGDASGRNLRRSSVESRYVDLICREAAAQIEEDPSLLDRAMEHLRTQTREEWIEPWAILLEAGVEAVVLAMRSHAPSARPMRAASPLLRVVDISPEQCTALYAKAR